MSNTLLTPTQVTRKALKVLHGKLNFVGTINRGYDDQFAKEGAKIGNTLRIREPNRYTVGDGPVISVQDTVESYVSLEVSNQKHVPMAFSAVDLTLSLDDFSERIIEPAMAVLAAAIEADALSMRKDVYNQVNNTAATMAMAQVGFARKKLVDNLAPESARVALLNTNDQAYLIDSNKGLFNPQDVLSKQYREGALGRTGGFDFYESTHLNTQSRGTADANYLTNQVAAQTGSSLIVDTGTGTINKGEILTIAGVYRVHPETKESTGVLQQFVVTEDYAGGGGTISISPAIVATGANQNVSNGAANDKAVTIAGTASTNYGQSLFYQKDAFTFATADLFLPKGLDFAAREVYDGISMRILRDFDTTNDRLICRADVLYGFKTLRAELASRVANTAPAA